MEAISSPERTKVDQKYVVETRKLDKSYGSVLALKDLSVRFEPGATGLLGPNGAGKSTLLKVLLGLLPYNSGTIKVLGMRPETHSLQIRQRIGFMPENDCFPDDLNAVTFLSYLGRLSGLKTNDAMQRAHESLYYVRIQDERYRAIKTYSSGMKQKMKLAQALIHDPDLIFLDEPTTGLDPAGRDEMLELIKGIVRDEKKSLVISSHILSDIESLCDRICIINYGELVEQGSLEELLHVANPPLVVKVRGDIPAFVRELDTLGHRAEVFKDRISIEPGEGVTDDTVKAAAKSGVQLRHLSTGTRNLEDLFVELLEKKTGKSLRRDRRRDMVVDSRDMVGSVRSGKNAKDEEEGENEREEEGEWEEEDEWEEEHEGKEESEEEWEAGGEEEDWDALEDEAKASGGGD
jgi:ABC-2 type transport system ATP-binding protein